MRINTIDDNYIMITKLELINVVFNSTEPREVKNIAMDMYQYMRENHIEDVIGVRKTPELLDKILNEPVDLEKFKNAILYAVENEEYGIVRSLQLFLKGRVDKKLKNLYDTSEFLANYIIQNGDYDYLSGENLSKKQDSDFTLFGEDEIIRIRLEKDKYVPKLQNLEDK